MAARVATLRREDTLKQNLTDGQICLSAVTQPEAAYTLKVGARSIKRARQVLDHGTPELVAAVDQGHIPVSVR